MKLILQPDNSKRIAKNIIDNMKQGVVCETNDIFVLDEILKNLNDQELDELEVYSDNKKWDINMLCSIRLFRGLDPRPKY